jgi:hypothetical protein
MQLGFFRRRYIDGQDVKSVALFGCDAERVAHLLGNPNEVQFLFVHQGYLCSRGEVKTRSGAPLFDAYRELMGAVPDLLVFPYGVQRLLGSVTIIDGIMGLSRFPPFGRHVLVFDLFYEGGGMPAVGAYSRSAFLQFVQSLPDPTGGGRAVRLVEAHNLTSLTVSNVRLQRDIVSFGETVYGVSAISLCGEEVLDMLQSKGYEYWYLVLSWVGKDDL